MSVNDFGSQYDPYQKLPKNLPWFQFQCRYRRKLKALKEFFPRWIQWLKWGHSWNRHLWLKYELLCERFNDKRNAISPTLFNQYQIELCSTLGLGRELYYKLNEAASIISEIKCQGLPADIRSRDQHIFYGASFYRLYKSIKL